MKTAATILAVILAVIAYQFSKSLASDEELFTREEVKKEIPVGMPENLVQDRLGQPSSREGNMWVYNKRLKVIGDAKRRSFSIFFEDKKVNRFLFEHR